MKRMRPFANAPTPELDSGAEVAGPEPAADWKAILALFVVFFAIAVAVQSASGTLRQDSETAHYSDEPAHVVTSLMIHDYIAAGFPGSPLRYAEIYYLHYPKVAIGMWPPVFHLVAAFWMFIFGAGKTSLLLLIAFQAAALATTLSWFGQRLFHPVIAAGLGALLLLNPLMQYCMTMVMLDVMVALLEFWSMLCLIRFFRTRKTSDGILFGFVTVCAMLTKGNADALVLMPPIMILLTRQWNVIKLRGLYAAGALILIIGGPWQLWSWRIIQDTVPVSRLNLTHLVGILLVYSGDLLRALGWPLTIVALVGFAVFLASILKRPAFGPEGLSLAAVASMFLAVIVFQCIAPVPSDERYMLPAVVPLLIFFVKGIRALAVSLTVPFSVPARELALAGLCLIVFAARTFSIPSRLPLGYSRVADLLRDPRSPSKVSLVCSDSNGEGALISEIAMGDKRPDRFVLRSSKVLSENEWDATAYRPYFSTPGKLLEYLDFVPVDAVAVDRSQFMWKGDRDILISTLNSAPDKWRQTADIPSGPISRHLVLYRRIAGATAGDHPNLKVNMRFTLGRVLSLQ